MADIGHLGILDSPDSQYRPSRKSILSQSPMSAIERAHSPSSRWPISAIGRVHPLSMANIGHRESTPSLDGRYWPSGEYTLSRWSISAIERVHPLSMVDINHQESHQECRHSINDRYRPVRESTPWGGFLKNPLVRWTLFGKSVQQTLQERPLDATLVKRPLDDGNQTVHWALHPESARWTLHGSVQWAL
ncbi:hypothetical protein PCANC_21867 [Puccinia coronata f. sp. avenae]|uniref:Uncharacterized protein n=1 Tax=Puccinia coronata f. sp. avenae TaxID=200324 RepID=A0A2N5S695_9BASI|nr:hypothetical protein PCANC_21867 [Puccinia coronata f. sp. avenae]